MITLLLDPVISLQVDATFNFHRMYIFILIFFTRMVLLSQRVYLLSNFLLKAIPSKTKVRAPPTILMIKSTAPMLILLGIDNNGRKSARLLTKAFCKCAESQTRRRLTLRKLEVVVGMCALSLAIREREGSAVGLF